MTNSNDAFLEVLESWLVKKLGYLADESIPVKLKRNCSDIDLVCVHPQKKEVTVTFPESNIKLKSRLLIESKGWLDYDTLTYLQEDLKKMGNDKVIKNPRWYVNFQFFREKIFKKGKEKFGTGNFHRVFVTQLVEGQCKNLKKLEKIKELKAKFCAKGIVLIEIHEILNDMFQYVSKKDKNTEEKAKLRTDLVLGIFDLIHRNKDNICAILAKKAKC